MLITDIYSFAFVSHPIHHPGQVLFVHDLSVSWLDLPRKERERPRSKEWVFYSYNYLFKIASKDKIMV